MQSFKEIQAQHPVNNTIARRGEQHTVAAAAVVAVAARDAVTVASIRSRGLTCHKPLDVQCKKSREREV